MRVEGSTVALLAIATVVLLGFSQFGTTRAAHLEPIPVEGTVLYAELYDLDPPKHWVAIRYYQDGSGFLTWTTRSNTRYTVGDTVDVYYESAPPHRPTLFKPTARLEWATLALWLGMAVGAWFLIALFLWLRGRREPGHP